MYVTMIVTKHFDVLKKFYIHVFERNISDEFVYGQTR